MSLQIVIYAFLIIAAIFQFLGSISLHRFPDVYTRLHGSTKCTTFGSIFIYLAIIIYSIVLFFDGKTNYAALALHTLIAMVFILLTNPTSAHAIARAAHRSGVMPKYAVVDKLSEEKNNSFKAAGKKSGAM